MKSAQKALQISLGQLLNWLKDGQFVVPDFQREFEWQPWDIRDLVRSIFLDYFIGNLLVWKGRSGNFEALSCEPIYGHTGTSHPQLIVLDGQQRLTAIHYAFTAPDVWLPNRKGRAYYWIRIDKFMEEQYDDAFQYGWESRQLKRHFSTLESQYQNHDFPCSILTQGMLDFPNWIQGYVQFWRDRAVSLRESGDETGALVAEQHSLNGRPFGEHVASIIQNYQISYIELDEELPLDKVCDIFTQLNSKGIRLDVFDLINALLRPKGLQLKLLWREALPTLEFVESDKMNVYVLQVMSLLAQSYCSPKYLYFLLPGAEKPIRHSDGTRDKVILVPDKEDFEVRWNEAVRSLQRAIQTLRQPQEYGVVDARFLPYVGILPVFAALQTHIRSQPHHLHFGAQRKFRDWYWASVFSNRYSGSVESTSARDFSDLQRWFENDDEVPALIRNFNAHVQNLQLRREVRRGSSIYNGIFNLLVIHGARDWNSNMIPPVDALDDHHIIPDSWGMTNLEGGLIHSILNRTPLTAETNRNVIGDSLPNEYLRKLMDQNGEAQVRATLETHFISPTAFDILLRDPFTPTDFEQFIEERERSLRRGIEHLLISEKLELAPDLRKLDVAIEAIELALRSEINARLKGDTRRIPGQALNNATGRRDNAERSLVTFDSEYFATLSGLLEFFDLRELQDTVVTKPNWPEFEPLFSNQSTLAHKFNQLASLRNGIRHSRSVSEIVRKEGEAAILWFQQVLGLSSQV